MSTLTPIAEAAQLLEMGDLGGAEAALARLPGREGNADARHLMGLIRLNQNRLEEGLAELNRSLALRPGHPFVLINLAKTYAGLGRAGEAKRALETALAAKPDLAEAWYALGDLDLRTGDAAAAEAHFRKALAQEPGHLLARLWLGITIKNAGRGAEAETMLADGARATDETALKAAFFYNLAQAQYLQGKLEATLANFTEAARLDPGLMADLNRSEILEEMLRFDEALAILEALLARDSANPQAHLSYNNLLHRLGRESDFLQSYGQAPQTPTLKAARAGLLLKKGRFEDARSGYETALAAEPDNLDAAIGGATALNELGRAAEGLALLENTLRYHPQSAVLFQNLAAAALQVRDPQKGAAYAEQSLRLAPVDQSGLAVLGLAWRMMGDARHEMLNGYDDLIRAFDLEPPQGFSSMEDFNHELERWLVGRHGNTKEPLEQSLRGGSQTRGYIFGAGHDLAERLKTRIDETIARYVADLKPDARHPFRGRAGKGFRYKDSWSSRLRDCGFHVNHIHPGGWISSCYYVGLPEAVKDEAGKQGWIKFGEPNFDVGLGVRRAIQPVAGRLVLFPSYMWHGTVPFHENNTRTTVAFDAVPLT